MAVNAAVLRALKHASRRIAMSWLSRFVNVVRSDRVDRDLDDEMRFHLDARTEEFTQGGPVHEEARRGLAGNSATRCSCATSSRDIKLLPRLESILRDVSFATAAVATQQAGHGCRAGLAVAGHRRLHRGLLADRRPDPAAAAGRRSAVAGLRRPARTRRTPAMVSASTTRCFARCATRAAGRSGCLP